MNINLCDNVRIETWIIFLFASTIDWVSTTFKISCILPPLLWYFGEKLKHIKEHWIILNNSLAVLQLEVYTPKRRLNLYIVQLPGAVEYTNCTSAEGQDHSQQVSNYNSKQLDCEVPVMLELWGMQSTSLLPSLPGSLWLGIVAPDRALFMG